MAARAHDKQAIDGPYLQIKDVDGFRLGGGAARRRWASTASGCCTPARSTRRTRCSPTQADFDHAENILDAYAYATSEAGGKARRGDDRRRDDRRGVAQDGAGDLGKGRAAGMQRTDVWTAPES